MYANILTVYLFIRIVYKIINTAIGAFTWPNFLTETANQKSRAPFDCECLAYREETVAN